MVRPLVRIASAGVLVVVSTLLVGCTQDSTISSGSSTAAFASSVTTAPADRWETARFRLFRAVVSPLDPDARTSLGGRELDLVPEAQTIDLRSQQVEVFFDTPLPAGEYRLDTLYWFPPTLGDQDADPDAPTCIEKITVIPPPRTTGIEVAAWPVPVIPPITFTAPGGGVVRLKVTIDAEAMVDDYVTRWNCLDAPAFCNQEPAPCLNFYDAFGFGSSIPQFVTVTTE